MHDAWILRLTSQQCLSRNWEDSLCHLNYGQHILILGLEVKIGNSNSGKVENLQMIKISWKSLHCLKISYLERVSINWINSVSRTETSVCGHTWWDVSNIGRSAGVGWVIVDDKVIIVSVTMELTYNCVLKSVDNFGVFSSPCT